MDNMNMTETVTDQKDGGAQAAHVVTDYPTIPPKATPTKQLWRIQDLEDAVKDTPPFLIEDWIPQSSVNIAVGDSGLGKSALFYLMGMCVASGKPFLDCKTTQGRVLIVDYENHHENQLALARSLRTFLDLRDDPDDFRIVPNPDARIELLKRIKEFDPCLVIIDSLRMFDPDAERDNTKAGEMLKWLKSVANAEKTAFLVIHHIRKPNDEYTPASLADTATLHWLFQASGARALINQTDVRIAIDRDHAEEVLAVRVYIKLSGDSGLIRVERVFTEAGDPIGYRRLTGIKQLYNQEQEDKFAELPNEFTFSDARRAYGKSDGATDKFLRKCLSAGILEKKHKRYQKVDVHTRGRRMGPNGRMIT